MKSLNESKYGFWGVLARKAKSLIDDDNASQKSETSGRKQSKVFDSRTSGPVRFALCSIMLYDNFIFFLNFLNLLFTG